MRQAYRLYKRNGIYYVRFVIPKNLKINFDKSSDIRYSLKTRDYETEQIGEIPNSSAQLICDIKQNRITPMPTFISNNNINKIKEGANFIEQELQKLEIQTPLITNERNR